MAKKKVVPISAENSIDPQIQKRVDRLNALDIFILEMLEREKGSISPEDIVQMLVIKLKHYAFMHSQDNDVSKVLVWLVSMVLYNSEQIFELTKGNHLPKGETV